MSAYDDTPNDDRSREHALVATDLVASIGSIGTVWQPGDGTRYVLGLTRITTDSKRGDHVLSIVVADMAYAVYLPAPWYPDPRITRETIPWTAVRAHLRELIPFIREQLQVTPETT